MRKFDSAAVAARITAGEEILGIQYPLNLAETAPLALPLSVSIIPELTTAKVQIVLFNITNKPSVNIQERSLRGCLIAHCGEGIILLDEDDPARMRFAAAHEIAHFVGHYLERRNLAVARLGLNILDVLDGKRDATPAERVGGILTGCPLGVFTDVMERRDGSPTNAATELMEYEADEAAFLALAPVGTVIARVMAGWKTVSKTTVIACLTKEFGLSGDDADRHAPRILSTIARNQPSFIDGLRMAAARTDAEH